MKILVKCFLFCVMLIGIVTTSGCLDRDSRIVSKNISTAADMFEINRRIIFYNGITGDYMLSIEGKCSIKKDGQDSQLEVTCKTGDNVYKKHYLGISDNVTYFVEQIDSKEVSKYFYKVIFKPSVIIPDVDIK